MQRNDKIPAELKALNQWVVWDYNEGRKIPMQLNGRWAKSSDPSTWHSYDEVKDHDKIGFVFSRTDNYTGVDFDDCFVDGKLKPEVQELVDANPTYSEVSPSGNGIKLWLKSNWSRQQGTNAGDIEVYSNGRFFTVTGDTLPNATTEVGPCDQLVQYICKRFPEYSLTDNSEGARREKMDSAYEEICRRDIAAIEGQNGDASVYQAVLVCFRHGLTVSETRELMHKFNVERCFPSWEAATFGNMLEHKIDCALDYCIENRELYTAENEARHDFTSDSWVALKDVVDHDVAYLWEGFIAQGHKTLLHAPPKAGKTTLLANLLKEATNGGGELFGQEVKPMRVLVVTEEAAITWKWRNTNHFDGALDNICLWDNISPLMNTAGWNAFWAQEQLAQFDLVIVDTLRGVAPPGREADAETWTRLFQPMSQLTSKGTAVMAIHHSRKQAGDGISASSGSNALTGAVDFSVYLKRTGKGNGASITSTGRYPGVSVEAEWVGNRYQEAKDSKFNRESWVQQQLDMATEPVTAKQLFDLDWPEGRRPSSVDALQKFLQRTGFPSTPTGYVKKDSVL